MRIGILDLDITAYHCAISCNDDPDFEAVKRTVDYFIYNWMSVSKSTHYVGYLTDSKSNFRNAMATTWKYKGHRKGKPAPHYLPAIREYLVEHWKAQVMVGVEADDALTIAADYYKAKGIECIIVTEDKDLLQYPGWHYNKNKDSKPFKLTEAQGHYYLWHQVITGDRTDNIPGVGHAATLTSMGAYNERVKEMDIPTKERQKLYKRHPNAQLYGPAGATKYLESFEPKDYPSAVWELYVDLYEDGDGDEGYGDLRFLETFGLIFMLREAPKGLEINFDYLLPPVDSAIESLFEMYD